MTLQEYIDEIKLKLTGGVLELEITDDTLTQIIRSSLREIQRYISETTLLQLPFSSCIDLSEYQVHSVRGVYRTEGLLSPAQSSQAGISHVDPLQAVQWQMLGGFGNLSSMSDWASNYTAWTTMQQIRNTMSTDLAHRYDAPTKKLYINVSMNAPTSVAIEYVPKFNDVSEITSEYWEDTLLRLSLAQTKVLLGRIRTKYTLNSSVWTMDGETMLNEGTQELTDLRTQLIANNRFAVCD